MSSRSTSRESNLLHFTIGAYPSSKLDLSQELRLVKVALLYADKAELYSIQSSMMYLLKKVADVHPRLRLKIIEEVAPYISSIAQADDVKKLINLYRESKKKKGASKQEILLWNQLERELDQHWEKIGEISLKIMKEAGADEIEKARMSGFLELHLFEGTDNDVTAADFMIDCVAQASGSPLLADRKTMISKRDDSVILEFVRGLSNAVFDGTTHPLFDDQVNSLIKSGIDKAQIAVGKEDVFRGKHSGLAGHLLNRLPSFDHVKIDELLDIKSELERPLIRFRSALLRFSDKIRSASWDDDFPMEAERLFMRDVAPTILDIEDAIKSSSYISTLTRKFIDKPITIQAGSIFSIILSHLSEIPDAIAYSLGVGVPTAALIFDAYKEWKKERQPIEQNELYFYYRVKEHVAK